MRARLEVEPLRQVEIALVLVHVAADVDGVSDRRGVAMTPSAPWSYNHVNHTHPVALVQGRADTGARLQRLAPLG